MRISICIVAPTDWTADVIAFYSSELMSLVNCCRHCFAVPLRARDWCRISNARYGGCCTSPLTAQLGLSVSQAMNMRSETSCKNNRIIWHGGLYRWLHSNQPYSSLRHGRTKHRYSPSAKQRPISGSGPPTNFQDYLQAIVICRFVLVSVLSEFSIGRNTRASTVVSSNEIKPSGTVQTADLVRNTWPLVLPWWLFPLRKTFFKREIYRCLVQMRRRRSYSDVAKE